MIVEKVGVGSTCSVYRGVYEGKEVVFKVMPIEDEKVVEKYRDVVRFDNFCAQHPLFFTRLLAMRVEEGWWRRDFDFPRSRLVLVSVFEPVLRDSLFFASRRMPPRECIAAYVSVLHCYELMREAGWLHPDAHCGNIMYRRTTDPHITIRGHTLPTFGRHWMLIDYDHITRTNANANSLRYANSLRSFENNSSDNTRSNCEVDNDDENMGVTSPANISNSLRSFVGVTSPANISNERSEFVLFVRENSHYFLLYVLFQMVCEEEVDREKFGVDVMMEMMCACEEAQYLRLLIPDMDESATLRIAFELLLVVFEPQVYSRLFLSNKVMNKVIDPLMRDVIVYAVQHIATPLRIIDYCATLLS